MKPNEGTRTWLLALEFVSALNENPLVEDLLVEDLLVLLSFSVEVVSSSDRQQTSDCADLSLLIFPGVMTIPLSTRNSIKMFIQKRPSQGIRFEPARVRSRFGHFRAALALKHPISSQESNRDSFYLQLETS